MIVPRFNVHRAALTVAAALIPVFHFFLPGGLSVSPDAAQYLYSARSLLEGAGYLGTNGSHLTTFPPGYPATLAAVAFLVGDLMIAALIVNMASLAVLAFTTHWVIERYTRSPMIPAAATGLLLINRGVWSAAGSALSESLGLALGTIALVLSIRLIESKRSSPALLMIALGGGLGLGGLVRTAGVLMAAGILLALLALRKPWWNALVVGIPAVVLPGSWVAVNLVLGGDAAGERVASADSPLVVLGKAVLNLTGWFTVKGGPVGNVLVPIGVVGLLALLVLLVLERRIFAIPAVRLVLLMNAIYFVLIVGVRVMVAMDDLGDRLLAPLAPGLIILAAIAADRTSGWRRVLAALVAGGLLLSGMSAVARSILFKRIDMVGTLQSEACPFVEGITISNVAGQLAWACDTPVQGSPRKNSYQSSQVVDDLPALYDTMSQSCVTLVWWADEKYSNEHRVPVSELEGFAPVHESDLVWVLRGGEC